jgi:hypothetical protein
MDFYEETIECMNLYKKAMEDVAYVTVDGERCFKPERFFERIKGIEYYSGYGHQEINPGLQIVFKDGSFLEREEYDGSEWWHFIAPKKLDVELEEFPDDIVIRQDELW